MRICLHRRDMLFLENHYLVFFFFIDLEETQQLSTMQGEKHILEPSLQETIIMKDRQQILEQYHDRKHDYLVNLRYLSIRRRLMKITKEVRKINHGIISL